MEEDKRFNEAVIASLKEHKRSTSSNNNNNFDYSTLLDTHDGPSVNTSDVRDPIQSGENSLRQHGTRNPGSRHLGQNARHSRQESRHLAQNRPRNLGQGGPRGSDRGGYDYEQPNPRYGGRGDRNGIFGGRRGYDYDDGYVSDGRRDFRRNYGPQYRGDYGPRHRGDYNPHRRREYRRRHGHYGDYYDSPPYNSFPPY